jgi:hypothetical protein
MDKTLHKKITEKHLCDLPVANGLYDNFSTEIQMLKEAANDLLKPRPQAIANLLKMAKAL